MFEMNNVEKSPKFLRTNSQICPAPEDELFAAVLENDINKIHRLVLANRQLLNHIYTPEYNKPILLIACMNDRVNARTVRALLDLGANPEDYDKIDGLEAIHLAARRTDSDTLRVLLDKHPNGINSLTKGNPGGNNALHELIRYGSSDSEEFKKCAELLISRGINVNQGDCNFVSPILWAAKRGQRDVIKLILERGSPVDIDSHKLRGQSARDVIQQKKLYDGDLPEPYVETNLNDKQKLFTLLKQRDENTFVNYRNGDPNFVLEDWVDADDSNTTLLQMACSKGLAKAVRHLIDHGANPNKICSNNESEDLPIVTAAKNGFSEIFGILLDHTEPPSTVLHHLLRTIDYECHDTKSCYDLLIKRIRKRWESGNRNDVIAMLNEKDNSGNTPLHYAVRYANKEVIEELLKMGASLGSKDKFGHMPVEDIDPKVLEDHLDDCVKCDLSKKIESGEDFEVTFDYRSIIPPYLKKSTNYYNKFDMESAKLDEGYKSLPVAETEVIHFMSNSPEYRHLLIHPVIVSFLFMKWKKVEWIWKTNLAFYITFSLALVAYIFCDYLYPADQEKSTGLTVLGKIAYILLLIGFFIFMLRETFQIFVAPINYFKGFENYIEVFLIILTGIILFKDTENNKQVASMAILLAVFESMLMLGPHPYFSTRVEMLKTVSLNFFKFLIWYVWLILAFALSFYILYSPNIWQNKTADTNNTAIANKTENSNTEEEDDNSKLFETPGRSLFKTVIMLTGEFDSGDLDFETFPITSTLIFALFIFMIAIILLNLLNGLAVSDTQMIKNESELIGHIVRAHYVRHIEAMFEGNIAPVNTLEKLRSICCCLPMARHWNCKAGRLFNVAYLFPSYLNYELTFYLYQSGKIHVPGDEYKGCRTCNTCTLTCLDKDTVKRTNEIIQSRKDGKINVDKQLQMIKETLNKILKLLNQIQ